MWQAVFPAIMHPSGMSPAFKTSAAVGVRNYPACTWGPQGYADYTGYAQVALYEANRGIWVVRLQDTVYGDTLQPFVYGAETASGLVNYGLRLSRAAGGCVGFDAGAFSCSGGGWTTSASSGASVTTVSGQAVFPKSPPHANPQTTWVVKTQTSGANQWAQAMASVNPTIAGPPNDGIGLIAFAMKSTNTYGEGGLAVSTSYGGTTWLFLNFASDGLWLNWGSNLEHSIRISTQSSWPSWTYVSIVENFWAGTILVYINNSLKTTVNMGTTFAIGAVMVGTISPTVGAAVYYFDTIFVDSI
jgi:hypothetical protein